MSRLHFHFGAGKLGIGAVLPMLNPDSRLVVVQRQPREPSPDKIDWNKIAANGSVFLVSQYDVPCVAGDNEYERRFRCERWKESKQPTLPSDPGDGLLLIVDDLAELAPVLTEADSISCALRQSGQERLAHLLRLTDGESRPVLAFENRLHDEIKNACATSNWVLHHVITDRICVGRGKPDGGRIKVECEPYIRAITTNDSAVEEIFKPALVTTRGKGSPKQPVRLVEQTSIEFHYKRKRWIVNSLHEILALLCTWSLATQGIKREHQYLCFLLDWLRSQYPDLGHAIDLYVRLQALRLTAECIKHRDAVMEYYGFDNSQRLFDELVAEAYATYDRIAQTPDLLNRLIAETKSEARNFREHVLKARDFVRDNEDYIVEGCAILGRPDYKDLQELERLLTDAFAEVMQSP